MKNIRRTALQILLLSSPFALLATPDLDRKIEAAARESYNYRTVLKDEVKVRSHDGVVTLTGKVRDADARELAEDTVENLPGVTRVENAIVVESPHPAKSDAWIEWKIRGRLLVKSNVSASTTDVSVRDGVVTLAGTAENDAQKSLTEIYAKEIDGVKSVRNEIVVRPSTSAIDVVAEKIDDASITAQVKYALLSHDGTRALQTGVETENGVVVVTGIAQSEAEKSLVSKLARDVRGTKSVVNKMTVTP